MKGDRCGKTVYQSSARAVADDLRHVVASLIVGGGAGNLDVVAQHMGTSVRTLQRRLRAVGVTYSEVVQQARCAAAEWMLRDQLGRISEVARALGYTDPAHFTRAFRRWTGSTPRDFRARASLAAKPEREPER